MIKVMKKNLKIACPDPQAKFFTSALIPKSAPPLMEIIDGIILGSYEDTIDKGRLKSSGVTHIINCAPKSCQNLHEEDFEYLNVNISDNTSFDILMSFYSIIDFIHNSLKKGGKIMVHCYQGVSRAPTVVVAYLIEKEKITAEEAFKIIKEKHKQTEPNVGFMIQLKEFYTKMMNEEEKIIENPKEK